MTLRTYAERGHKVHFICGNRSQEADYTHPNLRTYRFDCPEVKKFFSVRKIGFIFKSLWWLIFQVVSLAHALKIVWKGTRVDLAYGYETHGILAAFLLGKVFRAPIVSRFQGTHLKLLMGKPFWKIRFWVPYLAMKIPADLVIMTNDGTEGDKVLEALGVDLGKARFWRNGVDKRQASPGFERSGLISNLGLQPDDKILLAVSRLEKWKRLDRIITAMPALLEMDERISLLIVGDGTARAGLEALSRELKVEDHVIFLGAVPHDEISDFMQVADIFFSLYDVSNVANPLLEAMTHGKCIVTLDKGATSELIKNEVTGVLLGEDELDTLSECIYGLLTDANRREQLGSKAKDYADSNFWSWEERMDRELQEVESLVAEWRGAD